ncbi:MAG: type IV pilus modification protein PilV [Pseudomonadota bacterium]
MLIDNRRGSGKSSLRLRVRGISLVEVLVSILLAAIGLLALSGANVVSIRYSKMSQYRGTAAMLAADLAERMRTNSVNIVSYAVATDFAAQQSSAPATLDPSCESYLTTCPSIAATDLANWRFLVRSQLPQGSVFIRTTAAGFTPRGADVWIAWRDPAVANDAENNTDSRNTATECPPGLVAAGSDLSVRCSYFRINI